ncbi:MAG: hypothetical protein QXX75_04365 [Thermoplasmatales archaeon]
MTEKQMKQLSITVSSIYCISCSRLLQVGIKKIEGVVGLDEFPLSNKLKITFDPGITSADRLSSEIEKVAERCGLKGQIFIKSL